MSVMGKKKTGRPHGSTCEGLCNRSNACDNPTHCHAYTTRVRETWLILQAHQQIVLCNSHKRDFGNTQLNQSRIEFNHNIFLSIRRRWGSHHMEGQKRLEPRNCHSCPIESDILKIFALKEQMWQRHGYPHPLYLY
jgi:hypothetical protein